MIHRSIAGWKPRRRFLALVPILAAASACTDTTTPEPVGIDPAGVEPRASASTCGRLKSGETLRRGESVQSCDGQANLVHQPDGNVVLYDKVGARWATNTAGRTNTTDFVMQGDGNLVLYSTTGAVWSSGTWNHPGAFLGIQDDCNMVIYSGPAIWSTNTAPCRVDPLAYMENTSGWALLAANGNGQSTQKDASNLWIQKNPNDPTVWEQFGYTSSRVFLKRDTSSPVKGTAYDVSPVDAMFFPRPWGEGQTVGFAADIKYFNHKQTCAYNGNTDRWNHGVHKLRYVGGIDLGGELGYLPDVIIIDRYHDLAADQYNPRTAERFWYARGLGWVKWEYWDHYTRPRTGDPNWDRSDPYSLTHTAPLQTVTWNDRWYQGKLSFQKVC
jgi:hypothetical protein